MKNWKPIGDAASNVVRLVREGKGGTAPEYNELCDGFGQIVDDAVDEGVPAWVVGAALLHALAQLISQVQPKFDGEMKDWLLASVPKIFEWAAKLREGEIDREGGAA